MPPRNPPLTVTRSGPGFLEIESALNQVKRSEVYIGIPADRTLRRGDEMNNASLLFIHTHGSPLRNIPPRPVIEPALRTVAKPIADELAKSAKALLEHNPQRSLMFLKRAGVLGSNAAKRWFTNPMNGWPPNAPSTIAHKGSDRPLIDTGQLRRAITYAIVQGNVRTPAEQAEENI